MYLRIASNSALSTIGDCSDSISLCSGDLVEDVAEIAEPRAHRHDVALAQAIDRRVGDLAEVLPEVMVHAAIGVGQHRERRVVAHRADGFLAVLDHGMEDHLEILDRPADRELAAAQLVGREALLVAARPA